MSKEEAVHGLRETLREAVDCRMRSTEAVPCIELSGGLDSNTVAALAKTSGFDFTTASIKAPGFDATDESHLIERALEHLNVPNIAISVDELSYFDHLEKSLRRTGRVHSTASMCLLPALYAKVGKQGHRVILDGFDGDTVVGHGDELFALLAARGEWTACAEIIRELKSINSDRENSKMWSHYVVPIIRSSARKRGLKSFIRLVYTLKAYIGRSYWSATRYALRNMFDPKVRVKNKLERGYKGCLAETIKKNENIWLKYAVDGILNDLIRWGLEWKNNFASGYGVEARHPFMDKRVIEHCLSIPAAHKLKHGFNRWVMRECMKGLIPDQILWRAEKASFRPLLQHVIVNLEEQQFDAAVENLVACRSVSTASRRAATEAYDRIHSGKIEPKDYTAVWSALYATAWIHEYSNQHTR